MERRVFIPNKANHDYSPASRYGALRFLTVGYIPKFNLNSMLRAIQDGLKDSTENDYVMLTSLTILNVLTCTQFAMMHGRLNLLLFKDNDYIERRLVFDEYQKLKERKSLYAKD